MGWWAYCQPLAQRGIVEQDAPWFTVAPSREVEARAIARHHSTSFLSIDQGGIPAIVGDQFVQIGAHQSATSATLGPDLYLQAPHHADVRCPAWPKGDDRGGVCHDRKDSEALGRASSSTSEKSATPFLIPCHRATDGRFLALRPRRGTCQRKPGAGLLHIRCDPVGCAGALCPGGPVACRKAPIGGV